MEIMPNPQVMLVVFIVFMITMLMLNKFVFQPLFTYMDQREQKVTNDLQLVTREDNELQRIENEIHEVLSNAKAQAFAAKEEQIEEAKKSANAKIERIQNENREKMDAFMAKLQENRDSIKNDLRTNIGDIESLLTTKIRHI
ncbi:hypothetical protein [Helicobacter trogontum]|uniref:ATP synthase subunit b n=1 Tax=Helicobacter trogontum TaxID=50960 RepID=A0A4U8TCM2_9HELI|nr:hypothetical protein [Helicobacter trogontum]MCI5787249.1 hypothetical protein [Helicobacter trogontum]MDY5185097.1 hypothetical protein [Helicobacter trogontum]TLD96397.1 hypothetical protein LS80_008530 [Helicobacter trogontum]